MNNTDPSGLEVIGFWFKLKDGSIHSTPEAISAGEAAMFARINTVIAQLNASLGGKGSYSYSSGVYIPPGGYGAPGTYISTPHQLTIIGGGTSVPANTYLSAAQEAEIQEAARISRNAARISSTYQQSTKFGSLEKGNESTSSGSTFRSNEWLRATVPGQVAWDEAVTSWGQGNYALSASYTALMLGEQIMFVGTLGMSSTAQAARQPTTVVVSRWGREGLQSGDWVMKGGKSWWNYILSGKYQPQWFPGNNIPAPYSAGQMFTVSGSSLTSPPGIIGTIKNFLGQYIYKP